MLYAEMHRGVLCAMRIAGSMPRASPIRSNFCLAPSFAAHTPRFMSVSLSRLADKKDTQPPKFELGSQSTDAPKNSDDSTAASRAALWDQMLNTIIVDPVDSIRPDVKHQRSSDALGGESNSWTSSTDSSRITGSTFGRLENEFRERKTIGPPAPATPTSGRTVSATNSYGNASVAMLYRNLMSTLRRNNVRRELRLGERYEKPNQKRRRLRSERHRRRFADMIRKKVQLIMALKARGAEPLENTQTQDHSYPPEDTNPAMWQRVIQLIAGTLATGTMVYFVLYADFGEGEHCFMPIRRALDIDPEKLRKLFSTNRLHDKEV
ncbi:hypothetical protein MPSI1_002879 [Malassezia psittaci]|uniref:Uncharacterized protein n=1 Tax=Malassezia psittaci TaxID=1821823 RepID=A0AAF0FGM3_9BASI|nr:hypothetical protein MPSI1_002879 [Malassezia psittaci]